MRLPDHIVLELAKVTFPEEILKSKVPIVSGRKKKVLLPEADPFKIFVSFSSGERDVQGKCYELVKIRSRWSSTGKCYYFKKKE